jgi:hypothetical protein
LAAEAILLTPAAAVEMAITEAGGSIGSV